MRILVFLAVLLASGFLLSGADMSGTWRGTFAVEKRDPGPALVILKQSGNSLTGTAGPDESERNEIANGKVDGDTVTFDILRERGTMKFVLTLEGDTLKGQATREREGEQQTAKVTLKREK